MEEKETFKHMFIYLSNIKEELTEIYNQLRTPKGLPLDTLVDHFVGESQFFYRKIPLFISQAYGEIFQRFETVMNLLQVGEDIKKVLFPSDIEDKLGLKFLRMLHFARSRFTDKDAFKGPYTDFTDFENFYAHLTRRKKDEANTKLQIASSYFRYHIRKHFFKEDKRNWKKSDRDLEDMDYVIKDIKARDANVFGTPNVILETDIIKIMVRMNFSL